MESSRRELLDDMAEYRPILENKQNTHYSLIFQDRPMFSSINEKLSPKPLNGKAEHMHISKNNHVPPPFWFHTQNRYSILQTELFLL